MKDPITGVHLGMGIVDFTTKQGAEYATLFMDGAQIDGERVSVRAADRTLHENNNNNNNSNTNSVFATGRSYTPISRPTSLLPRT
jgi:RNA recognition motif-containing protein